MPRPSMESRPNTSRQNACTTPAASNARFASAIVARRLVLDAHQHAGYHRRPAQLKTRRTSGCGRPMRPADAAGRAGRGRSRSARAAASARRAPSRTAGSLCPRNAARICGGSIPLRITRDDMMKTETTCDPPAHRKNVGGPVGPTRRRLLPASMVRHYLAVDNCLGRRYERA